MKLKVLFFPFMMVLSFALVLLYGWPWFNDLKLAKTELDENRMKMNEIQKEDGNAEVLYNLIQSDNENVQFTYKYLAREKKEESLIDSINYIALNTSGVSLVDISISKSTANTSAMLEQAAIAQQTPDAAANSTVNQANVGKADDSKVRYVTLKIGIIGQYENIKTMLARINEMPFYKKIEELSIKPVEEKSATNEVSADGMVSTEVSESNPKQNANLLNAEITANFGYLNTATSKGTGGEQVFEKDNFDFSVIEKIKNSTDIKVPEINVGNVVGKSNPFQM